MTVVPDPVLESEVHLLRSDHVGDEFQILVGHCGSAASDAFSVVYISDPWAGFGTAVEIVRCLRLGRSVPPILVVGVGYRTSDFGEIAARRARDLTPTVDPDSSETAMGGADRFLAFLRDELKPWVGERYGGDPDHGVFFGYSYGGLFATYAMLTDPGGFRGYGIGSPSLWWHREAMFELETEYAGSHRDLRARAFVGVGGSETLEGHARYLDQLRPDFRAEAEAAAKDDPPVDMVGAAERMVAALRGRGYPGLELEFEVMPGEYHNTAEPMVLSRSLRYLFGAPR